MWGFRRPRPNFSVWVSQCLKIWYPKSLGWSSFSLKKTIIIWVSPSFHPFTPQDISAGRVWCRVVVWLEKTSCGHCNEILEALWPLEDRFETAKSKIRSLSLNNKTWTVFWYKIRWRRWISCSKKRNFTHDSCWVCCMATACGLGLPADDFRELVKIFFKHLGILAHRVSKDCRGLQNQRESHLGEPPFLRLIMQDIRWCFRKINQWLVVWNMCIFHFIYGMVSSFPLTKSIIFHDGDCTTICRGAATEGLICAPAESDFQPTIDVLREALQAPAGRWSWGRRMGEGSHVKPGFF